MTVTNIFQDYKTSLEGKPCYIAGLPGYPRNFSRDVFISGFLAHDMDLLVTQLKMSSYLQGKKDDVLTGEELGKIHHEYPGVIVNKPYLTTFNACDTTALYLIAMEFLQHLSSISSATFLESHQHNLNSALAYLDRHIVDDIFWEFPPKSEQHYSLRITYWKDSVVTSAEKRTEPTYPVAFALVQFQVARGLLAAAQLLNREDLSKKADQMYRKGISKFINKKSFCVMQDDEIRLEQISSDEVHSLAYIPRKYAKLLPIEAIAQRANQLITPVGIACTTKETSNHMRDKYHGYVVWIFEQALINYGCQKFGLTDLAAIATKCKPYILKGQELLAIEPDVAPLGNAQQLWSTAAKLYFSDSPSLRNTGWL